MDTRIALAGTPIDFAGSMTNGLNAGMMQRQAQQQNALAQLYQTQGPQIMAGNPQALNALAQMDPNAALGVQQSVLGVQTSQFNLEQVKSQAREHAAVVAAKMTADQAAAESAKLGTILQGAAAAPDEATYNGWLMQNGVNPADHPFAQRDMWVAAGLGAKDALDIQSKRAALTAPTGPDWRAATPQEAASYGAAGGQINTKTGEFKDINPPSNGITITNPDGTRTQIGGTANAAKPLTVDEAKNTGFLIRMNDSGKILDQFEGQGLDYIARLKTNDPSGLANYTQSPEFQMYDQAKRDFLNAVLRRESGAVIGPTEFASGEQQYFPVPGDSPAVIAQKRKNRENAIKGVEVGSGAGVSNPLVTGDASMAGTQASPLPVGAAGEGFDKVKPGQFYVTADGSIYQKQ